MIKKIAAIHDLSSYGRASLTVAIPILSYMGFQVCPLPTAVLSAHSEYQNYRCTDLTDHMVGTLEHWKELNLSFDALYSGYLASERQMEVVKSLFRDFKTENNFILVDPVLGDNHKLYSSLNVEMIKGMRELCSISDIITPNMTEAAFLLDEDPSCEFTEELSLLWCKRLCDLGPKHSIITSAPANDNTKLVTLAHSKESDRTWRIENDYVPASYPGTGDAFASVMTGSILKGDSIPEAIERAVKFIKMGIRATYGHEHNPLNGINQEKALCYLNETLSSFSYQEL